MVPVLVDAARMPRAAELPADLQALARLNAFSLRTAHSEEDMDDLPGILVGGTTGQRSRWRRPPLTPTGVTLRALAGLAAGAVLLVRALPLANRHLTHCYDLVCTLKTRLGPAAEDEARGLLWRTAAAALAASVLTAFMLRAPRGPRG